MADATPAQSGKTTEVAYYAVTRTPMGAEIRTNYRHTVAQAARNGAIALDAAGKISGFLKEGVVLTLPKGVAPEDIMSLDFLRQLGLGDDEETDRGDVSPR